MDIDIDSLILPVFKYLSGQNEHICRLCFGSTEKDEVSIEDIITLQEPFVDETLTFLDMFDKLGIAKEPFLPKVICNDCAVNTINSYLFQKLYQYSKVKWKELLNSFEQAITLSDSMNDTIQSIYLIVNRNNSIMFTSKKTHSPSDKKNVIKQIKSITKNRKKYLKTVKVDLNISCFICSLKFKSKYDLVKHINKAHRRSKVTCSECDKIFMSQIQLDEHLERIHYPKRIQCLKCSKMFSTERMLALHDKMNHVSATCKLCVVEFPSKTALRAHINKHNVNVCPKCNKSLSHKHAFKIHLKQCGSVDSKRPTFFCDICSKGYIRKNGLRTHLKIDHGFGNVLSCNWCNKKFDAISKLNMHVVKHTKEKKFQCEQCHDRFVTKAALTYHMRLHTGERPFPCDMCNQSFLSASRRLEHKRRKHWGPSKKCHICDMKFVTNWQLRKHEERHFNPESKLYVHSNFMLYKNTNRNKSVSGLKSLEPLRRNR